MTNRALAKLYQVPENKEGRPTTAKGELDLMVEKLAEVGHPDRVLELVQDIRSLDYNLNTQIPNWKPQSDGRCRCTWGFLAASGQLNSVRPNYLNISKWSDEGQRFRRIIEAPYGYSFLEFDKRSFHVCFDETSEILTTDGWVCFDKVSETMKVAQYLKESGRVEFILPTKVFRQQYSGNMVNLTTNNYLDVFCTEDHECLVASRLDPYKALRKIPIQNVREHHVHKVAGTYVEGSVHLQGWQVTMLAALQADGSISKTQGSMTFSLFRPRKIERMRAALIESKLKFYEEYLPARTDDGLDGIRFYIPRKDIPKWLVSKKYFGRWVLKLDLESIRLLSDEVLLWDGSSRYGTKAYYSSIKSNVDWVQVVWCLSGRRSMIKKYGNTYTLRGTDTDEAMGKNLSKIFTQFDGMVYCVSVPSGNIVTRRNGKVIIVGNCTMGYCADDPSYIRFSQLDPHSIFASHITPRDWTKPITLDMKDGEILERSSWLKKKCKEMKATIGVDFRQDVAKNTVLANQLGQREWNFYRKHRKYITSVEEAKRLQDTLNDMFSLVTAFKNNIREIVYDGGKKIEGGMARRMRERWGGPKYLLLKEWGVIDYFFDVFNWRFKPKSRSFERVHGTDSEKAIAFCVQGEAFGMLKYEIRGMDGKGYLQKYGMINSIHDSVVFLCRDSLIDSGIVDINGSMGAACPRMVLPATGEVLKVGVEASVGKNLQAKDYFGKGTNPRGMEEVRI